MVDKQENEPLQKANPLPREIFNVGFFEKNKLEMIAENKEEDLQKQDNNQPQNQTIPISPIFNPVLQPMEITPQKTNPVNLKLNSDNTDVVPEKQQTPVSPLKSNIAIQSKSSENIEPELKSESLNKTNFNMSEINNQHKEIKALDERIKVFPQQKVQRGSAPTIVNNYSNAGSGGGGLGANRSDPLSSIKTTMRTIPAWRTEMG